MKWVKGSAAGLLSEGWFLLEISPISSQKDLPLILADIHYNREMRIKDGSVYHLDRCLANHQLPKKLKIIEKLLLI